VEVRRNVASATWSSVDADLLRRVRRTSIILGLVMAAPFATYFGLMPAAGWLAGIAWSLANLAAIHSIVRRVLTEGERDRRAIAFALAVKFPVLYAAGFVLLAVARLPVMWWVAGFSWPFFVAVMKAAGRIYLHLDDAV
jgi:hypothetical protein